MIEELFCIATIIKDVEQTISALEEAFLKIYHAVRQNKMKFMLAIRITVIKYMSTYRSRKALVGVEFIYAVLALPYFDFRSLTWIL